VGSSGADLPKGVQMSTSRPPERLSLALPMAGSCFGLS